jgi:hypothetical protein
MPNTIASAKATRASAKATRSPILCISSPLVGAPGLTAPPPHNSDD